MNWGENVVHLLVFYIYLNDTSRELEQNWRFLNESHNLCFMQLPSFLDWFGWCTWDAFYTDVTAEGIEEGLKR